VSEPLRIALLGLGEAGSIVAEDLAGAASVSGYDPLVTRPTGAYERAASGAMAVADADVIIALTAGHDAEGALASAAGVAQAGTIYADLSSSSPALKRRLAATAEAAGLRFVDGVFVATVPARRSATPLLASGPGASAFADAMAPLGMQVTVVGAQAGEAATRKLLRSIVMKGMTALLVESLRAAEATGELEWYTEHIRSTLTDITPELLTRLLDGTLTHSARRVHEMQAAVELVEGAGVEAPMTRATVEVLGRVGETGIPRGSAL